MMVIGNGRKLKQRLNILNRIHERSLEVELWSVGQIKFKKKKKKGTG